MPNFSQRSLDNLNTCDPRLIKLFNEVIKHYDCTVLEGHRGEAEQNEAFRTGKSQLKYPNGNHNSIPSKAVDVIPYHPTEPHYRWNDWNSWYHFTGTVFGIATQMGIKLRLGIDWDGDHDLKDSSFIDAPHFEVVD